MSSQRMLETGRHYLNRSREKRLSGDAVVARHYLRNAHTFLWLAREYLACGH